MDNFHTYDDLIRFIYREMSAEEAVAMADCVDSDLTTRLVFDELLLAKSQLPKVQFNPSPRTLNNILQHSTKTTFEAYL